MTRTRRHRPIAAFAFALLSVALAFSCSGKGAPEQASAQRALEPYAPPKPAEDPAFEPAKGAVLIRGTVMTAAGEVHERGHVLIVDGIIQSVGPGPLQPPEGARIYEEPGQFVTPGLIDTHSHLGVYPMPHVDAHADGNEMSNPVTAHVSSEHAFWPQDPGLWRALSGGVTIIQVLPGSGNLIGGRSFVARLKSRTSAHLMRFPGAPQGLKMACGENPKRYYGEEMKRDPKSRMGNVAGYRAAFQKAYEYRRARAKYERDLALWKERRERGEKKASSAMQGAPADDKPDDPPEPPARDLVLEVLADVLDGKILVHNHCYRADEMHLMLDLAKEYGFKIRSFHHAIEAYKLADRLAAEDVAVSTWADWWGFKMEAFDGLRENAALVTRAGARAVIHSDSNVDVRRLNQEAAKAYAAALAAGIDVSEDQALRWITANAAWVLGVHEQVGTLEKGKRGDVVVWNGHPFSVYSLASKVFVDGELVYDRSAKDAPISDFELGHVDPRELP